MKKLILGITFLFALAIATPSVASVVIDNPVKKEVKADSKVTDTKKCCASADSKTCSGKCAATCKADSTKAGCCKNSKEQLNHAAKMPKALKKQDVAKVQLNLAKKQNSKMLSK